LAAVGLFYLSISQQIVWSSATDLLS